MESLRREFWGWPLISDFDMPENYETASSSMGGWGVNLFYFVHLGLGFPQFSHSLNMIILYFMTIFSYYTHMLIGLPCEFSVDENHCDFPTIAFPGKDFF